MNVDRMVRSLSLPLPEHIQRLKDAGLLDECLRAIDIRLQRGDLPAMLRDRLITEKERLRRLPTQYRWNRVEALRRFRELVPDLTEAEFDRLEAEGLLDFILLSGEKRYFVRFHRSAVKAGKELAARAGTPFSPDSVWLDPMIREIREKGSLTRRITLRASVGVEDAAFVPGVYRAWLPCPAASAQQHDIELLDGAPDSVAPEDAEARTAYWERRLEKNELFTLTYRYQSTIRYADPLHQSAPAAPLYPAAPAVRPEDLAEDPPFIRFTPYLRALAAELAGEETEPVRKAWRFYTFITEHVRYAFVRDYFQIDHIGEYCAVNLQGDCGLQALLFITLCRIAGIPARWQSGMSIDGDGGGSHDWAQFYLDGWGWLFADPSYGGGAFRNGNRERQAFYFGNIDPMRMAANRRFEAPFAPASEAFRYDPYDNQSGEVERVGAGQPFTGRDLDGGADLVTCETI